MIVVDASAALSALLDAGPAREMMGEEQIHVPHLIDSEIANGIRRKVGRGELGPDTGWAIIDIWRRLGMIRYATFGILDRIWELRDNLSAYDASYVALAEELNCPLLTGDGRLARASGLRCPVTVVPR